MSNVLNKIVLYTVTNKFLKGFLYATKHVELSKKILYTIPKLYEINAHDTKEIQSFKKVLYTMQQKPNILRNFYTYTMPNKFNFFEKVLLTNPTKYYMVALFTNSSF